jgi:hypothetical protein
MDALASLRFHASLCKRPAKRCVSFGQKSQGLPELALRLKRTISGKRLQAASARFTGFVERSVPMSESCDTPVCEWLPSVLTLLLGSGFTSFSRRF